MRFKRTASDCENCPLRGQPKVWGEGPSVPDLVIIGEAPGRREQSEGRPFVGDAGRYLNIGLGSAGIIRHRCYIMNVIICKPPDTKNKNNDINCEEAQEAVECCRPGFIEELGFVTRKCKTILALGETALKFLMPGIEDGIMKVRGSVYDYGKLQIIPTYHPAFLGYMKKSVKTIAVYQADLKKAKRISDGGRWVYPEKRYNLNPTFQEVLNFLEENRGKSVTVDVEATSLNPIQAQIVCLGIGVGYSKGLCIPFMSQGGTRRWGTREEAKIKTALVHFFCTSTRTTFHNACYDYRVLWNSKMYLPYAFIEHDTMILSHLLNPELPQNLGFCASIYADVPYHKGLMLNRKTRIVDIPDEDLREYNVDDCTVLARMLPNMLSDLKEMGLEELYYNERMKIIRPLVEMMNRGIKLDKKFLKKWVVEKKEECKKKEAELIKLGQLPEMFNLNSPDDLRLFLFGIVPNKCKKAVSELKERMVKIENYRTLNKNKRVINLLNSNVHKELKKKVGLSELKPLYEVKGFRSRKTKEKKQHQVNEDNLLSLRNHLNRRLEAIDNMKHPDRFIEEKIQVRNMLKWLVLLNEYTRLSTLISNYSGLGRHVENDGRIHCSMNPIGTRTGRISFSEPNLGTLPKKRGKSLRKAFISEPGFIFLSADYSNAEFVALAYVTQDPTLIEIVEKGLNIHDENTKAIFRITPDASDWKEKRDILKQYQFGSIQYGGSDREIFQGILLDCPNLEMTFAEFKRINYEYGIAHPVHMEWKRRQQETALKNRKVKTPMGFTRTLYGSDRDIKKQAINTPIQGLVAHLINWAMIEIEEKLTEYKSKMILQVYDQLVFEVWPIEKAFVIDIIKEVMEKPVDIYGQPVSFKVDISEGLNFGELKEVSK